MTAILSYEQSPLLCYDSPISYVSSKNSSTLGLPVARSCYIDLPALSPTWHDKLFRMQQEDLEAPQNFYPLEPSSYPSPLRISISYPHKQKIHVRIGTKGLKEHGAIKRLSRYQRHQKRRGVFFDLSILLEDNTDPSLHLQGVSLMKKILQSVVCRTKSLRIRLPRYISLPPVLELGLSVDLFPTTIANASKLEDFSYEGPVELLLSSLCCLPYEQLKTLALHCDLTVNDCLEILSHCKNTQDIKIDTLHNVDSITIAVPRRQLHLRELTTLHIFSAVNPETFISHLTAPDLESLYLGFQSDDIPVNLPSLFVIFPRLEAVDFQGISPMDREMIDEQNLHCNITIL